MRRTLTAIITTLALLALSVAACDKKSADASPTATFQTFYEALKNKDIGAYKKSVSKNTLAMLEKRAQDMSRSLDEYLKQEMEKSVKPPDKLETRNEKIEGTKATLEVKNTEGGWNTVPFVKEDGQWKVAVDEL